MKSIFLAVALTISTSSACFADWDPVYEYQRDCVLKTGILMGEKQCADLKREADQEEQRRQRQEEFRKNSEAVQEQRRQEELARQSEEEAHKKQIKREYEEEQARLNKQHDDFVREEAREESALKHKCGKDYMALRIGMKIKRLEQCLGAIYETETVTAKGRIVTYRTTFDWVYVQNGIVTGYTERTDN